MEERLQAIEKLLNELQITVDKASTKADLISSLNIKQAEIDNLRLKIDSLKGQVELLQAQALME